jgi:hypothetical protein
MRLELLVGLGLTDADGDSGGNELAQWLQDQIIYAWEISGATTVVVERLPLTIPTDLPVT